MGYALVVAAVSEEDLMRNLIFDIVEGRPQRLSDIYGRAWADYSKRYDILKSHPNAYYNSLYVSPKFGSRHGSEPVRI